MKFSPYYLEIFQVLSGSIFCPENSPETCPEIDFVRNLFQNKWNFSILSQLFQNKQILSRILLETFPETDIVRELLQNKLNF